MSIYLIVVMLVLPGPGAPQQVLQHTWMTASSERVCLVEAARLAAIQRQLVDNVIRTTKAKVQATCDLRAVLPEG